MKYSNNNKEIKATNNVSNIVALITRFIKNIGLLINRTSYEIHWLSKILTVCFLITTALQITSLIMGKDEPDKLFECFSVLAFTGMGVFKLSSLLIYNTQWRFILNQMLDLENSELNGLFTSNLEYQSDSEDSTNFSNHIHKYTKNFKSISAILRKIYNFTAVIYISSPFLEQLFCRLRGKECIKYPHILPAWAPFDDYSFLGYLITVLIEFLSAVYCVSVHIAFDLTTIGIMIFVCGQFSLLRDYSELIGGKGKICKLSKKRDERARFRIKHCHRTNIILVNSISELDRLLRSIIGVYFFLATFTLCSVAVQLKSKEMSIMQLISLLQYMGGTLIQLFMFCRYGDTVLNDSSIGIGQGPFGAAYWCLSPGVRGELLLLGISMMKQKRIRAGPFSYLNLPSFIQIIRTAYSYYAVIVQK